MAPAFRMSRAGVLDCWVTQIFELNIGHGPYCSRTWHKDMEAEAFDIAKNCSPDDPWLLHCWPGICEDNSWCSVEDTGREARERYLNNLVAEKFVKVVGPKVSWSKWWSIYNEARLQDSYVWSKLFFARMPICAQGVVR